MKILIAEDDVVSLRVLEHNLRRWEYEVVIARDGQEAWERIQTNPEVQLAILDWMMPRMDGLEVCRRIRAQLPEPYIYIVLLTARNQPADTLAGLDAGADDYLVKPVDPRELQVRVRAGRRIIELQADLIAAREALREQATRDLLTRLWNRAAILDLLERAVLSAERRNAPVSVLMADLDHFKHINDTYGHATGDTALRDIAQHLSVGVRASDAVGRYGGEEFLIVLPDCEAADALTQAERLRASIHAQSSDTADGRLPITLSLGVATSTASRRLSSAALIESADVALYRAKNEGRNCVRTASFGGEGE